MSQDPEWIERIERLPGGEFLMLGVVLLLVVATGLFWVFVPWTIRYWPAIFGVWLAWVGITLWRARETY